MTDIIPEAIHHSAAPLSDRAGTKRKAAAIAGREELYWYIEALFFAYREFISEPDRILSEIGFGRAHHRVLHFVDRYPGLRVADLLEILQITKQSLARVLRELIKKGYIEQEPGKADKRERLLYVTEKGAALAGRLAAPQLDRMEDALAAVGKDGVTAVADFFNAMIAGSAGLLPDSAAEMPLKGSNTKKVVGK